MLMVFLHVCVCVSSRHYLEARSLNHRLNSWEGQNRDMTCEQDGREYSYRDGDRDWHHYSKSSGRSGRSHRSRRSSRRHRDRRRRRSSSRQRSPSVWEPLSSPLPFPLSVEPNQMGLYNRCLANASHPDLCLYVSFYALHCTCNHIV